MTTEKTQYYEPRRQSKDNDITHLLRSNEPLVFIMTIPSDRYVCGDKPDPELRLTVLRNINDETLLTAEQAKELENYRNDLFYLLSSHTILIVEEPIVHRFLELRTDHERTEFVEDILDQYCKENERDDPNASPPAYLAKNNPPKQVAKNSDKYVLIPDRNSNDVMINNCILVDNLLDDKNVSSARRTLVEIESRLKRWRVTSETRAALAKRIVLDENNTIWYHLPCSEYVRHLLQYLWMSASDASMRPVRRMLEERVSEFVDSGKLKTAVVLLGPIWDISGKVDDHTEKVLLKVFNAGIVNADLHKETAIHVGSFLATWSYDLWPTLRRAYRSNEKVKQVARQEDTVDRALRLCDISHNKGCC